MTITHKIDSSIRAGDRWPTRQSPRPGDQITSDSLTGVGDLVGSYTNCTAGGSPMLWEGVPGAFERTTTGAVQTLGIGKPAVVYSPVSDIEVAVTVEALPVTSVGLVYRRETINILGGASMYQVVIYPAGLLQLAWRKGAMETLSSWSGLAAGDRLLVRTTGDRHRMYVNGTMRIDVTDGRNLGAGYVGFGPSGDIGDMRLRDFSLKAL